MPRKTTEAPARRRRRAQARAPAASAPIDLALQGGGSHGAFTWGVLDRLLEDPDLRYDGISGTSAGALNAAVMASGWASGGRDGARQALAAFWHGLADAGGAFGSAALDPWAATLNWFNPAAGQLPLADYNLDLNPLYQWSQQFTRLFSPYQWNPGRLNVLAGLVQRHVDLAALQRGPLRVFVVATAVESGQPRVFSGPELSHQALLASACLPHLFRAVEIDGKPYWDGGYSGNPALWPLIYRTPATDLLLVRINPLHRPGTPDNAAEIADRIDEITFNAGLVAEMRAIRFVQRLLAEQRVEPGRYRSMRLHMIADDAGLAPLTASSKLNTDGAFLARLHALGRQAAERWLSAHRADLGQRSTLDIDASFLAERG